MSDLLHRAQAGGLRATLAALRALPLERRIRALGAITAGADRLAGPRRRARANLRLALPELPEAERDRIARAAARNVGEVLATIFYAPEFGETLDEAVVSGPGWDAAAEAHRSGRGGILLSGHFGRWEVARWMLKRAGMESGGIYRVNNNRHYDPLFRDGITLSGAPMVPKGRAGVREIVRHLKGGGLFGMLVDQHDAGGAPLELFGHRAWTTTMPAELALKLDLPLIPAFSPVIDGRSTVRYEAPIPPSDPETMMQGFNDVLERWVRRHPEQWYWVHRRWKPGSEKQARRHGVSA